MKIRISDIKIRKRQRKNIGDVSDLKKSIETFGFLGTIWVTKEKNGNYELLSGARRLKALKDMGQKEVDVTVISLKTEEQKKLIELFENIKRQDLRWDELATSVEAIHEILANKSPKTHSIVETAEILGFDEGSVYRFIELAEAIKEHPEIKNVETQREALTFLKRIKGKRGETIPDWFRPINLWQFKSYEPKTGISDFPGKLPGQIIRNILYYFTNENDLVIDPLAGSGTTIDICKSMKRQCLALDLTPVRSDILKRDILTGFPTDAKDCELIILDIPYGPKYFQKYSDLKEDLVNMKPNDFYSAIEKIVENCYKTVKLNGKIALIFEPYMVGHDFADYGFILRQLFRKRFSYISRVIAPLSQTEYKKDDFENAKDTKTWLNVIREIFFFKKEK